MDHLEKWNSSLQELLKDKISVEEFKKKNEDLPVFYSTPFGEDGKPYLLSHPSGKTFFPVYLTVESCEEQMSLAGRDDFPILTGTLGSVFPLLESQDGLRGTGVAVFDGKGVVPLL